jgi:hypothetical protein
MKTKYIETTQPHVYCDKNLYREYRNKLKALGRDLMQYNRLVFERAIKKELEALKKLDNKTEKLISEL